MKSLALLLILAGTAMAGVRVGDTIEPMGPGYPTTKQDTHLGGWHSGTSTSGVPAHLRQAGMAFYDTAGSTLYILGTNSVWEVFSVAADVAQVAGDLLIVSQRVDTVEGWGDHKTNNYLKAETNPIYVASLSSGSSMIVDAATNTIVDLTLTNNVVLMPPTNAPNARKLQWRIRADGGDYTVAMTNAAFRIPAAASMTNVVTVSNATTSIVLMDYHEPTEKWFIEAYVWGY